MQHNRIELNIVKSHEMLQAFLRMMTTYTDMSYLLEKKFIMALENEALLLILSYELYFVSSFS
jgi:hypothetical protein